MPAAGLPFLWRGAWPRRRMALISVPGAWPGDLGLRLFAMPWLRLRMGWIGPWRHRGKRRSWTYQPRPLGSWRGSRLYRRRSLASSLWGALELGASLTPPFEPDIDP